MASTGAPTILTPCGDVGDPVTRQVRMGNGWRFGAWVLQGSHLTKRFASGWDCLCDTVISDSNADKAHFRCGCTKVSFV